MNQNFVTSTKKIWCTDFTYIFLDNGTVRYNCTIINLFDRSVIASLNGDHITAELAIETVELAIQRHKPKKGLILHSYQGTQFTSHDFNLFCEKSHIQQSMSRAGCPYDKAPMELYHNTLKPERMNHFSYKTKAELDSAVNEFAYVWYDHVRPYRYNDGKTPAQARAA